MKRFFALALMLMLLPLHTLAEPLPVYDPGVAGKTAVTYDTDTLRYAIVRFTL